MLPLATRFSCVSALVMQVYVTIGIQGYVGVLSGSRPPEDVTLFPDAGPQSFDCSAKYPKSDDAKAKAAIEVSLEK